MSVVVYGVLVVGAACLAAVVGLSLVQRLVPVPVRKEHNDVAGFIYAVLGVIYAVLLALVVIAVWEEHERARITVESEANALAEIFWLAHRLPEPEGRHVQELARSYAEVVVDEEWPLMEQRRTPLMEHTRATPPGWVLIDDIRVTLQEEVEPRTVAGQEHYAEGLDQLQRLADARRTRLVEAEESVPAVLWVVLVVGGMVAVGFTYLFGLENTWAHRLMVASLFFIIHKPTHCFHDQIKCHRALEGVFSEIRTDRGPNAPPPSAALGPRPNMVANPYASATSSGQPR